MLTTPRLELVAISPDLARLAPAELSALLHARIPESWPPEHWEPHVFEFIAEQFRTAPHTVGWNRYMILRGAEPVMVGALGGFPRSKDEAEVGYSILPEWQKQGLATEGLRALIGEIFEQPEVETISAQTFPSLPASIRVLEKCGFMPAGNGDDEGTIRFRLERGQR